MLETEGSPHTILDCSWGSCSLLRGKYLSLITEPVLPAAKSGVENSGVPPGTHFECV